MPLRAFQQPLRMIIWILGICIRNRDIFRHLFEHCKAHGDVKPSRLEQWQVINTTTWKATDNLTVKNIASYAQLRDLFNSALFATNFHNPTNGVFPYTNPIYKSAGATGIPFLFSDVYAYPGSLTAAERTMSEELQLQGNALDQRLTWQGGAYFELELPKQFVGNQSGVYADRINSATFNCSNAIGYAFASEFFPAAGFLPFGGSINQTIGRTKYRDYAFYFQDTYKITDQFKLTTGLRWTNDREQVEDIQKAYDLLPYPAFGVFPAVAASPRFAPQTCSAGGTLPTCLTHLEQKSQVPTWLIDFDYTPLDNLLLYAKYTRGYREGTINPTAPLQFDIVQAEKVDTYEVGEKFAFHGPLTGTLDAALFYNDFRNQQIQLGFEGNPRSATVQGNPFAAPQNAGKSRIWGAELDSSVKLFAGVVCIRHPCDTKA